MDGAVVLDKSEGITSHDAVVVARRVFSEKRIGHLGTLDPFASGVLVLLVGRATRLARFYREREKAYEGAIRFGFSTTTFDRDGEPTSPDHPPVLAEQELRSLFQEFLGTRLQQPPLFSAKKISGVPAYRLMRKGR
ncbi:MAG: tRNA pseudouridine(55) synthase TruB, partial [Terriglobia bacterium]